MSQSPSVAASPSNSSAAAALNVSLLSPPLQSAFSPLVSPTRAGVHQPIVDDVGGQTTDGSSVDSGHLRLSVASSSGTGRQFHDRMTQLRIGRSLLSPMDDSAGVMSPSDFSASHTTRSLSADVGSDGEEDAGTDRHYFRDDDEFRAEAEQQTFFTYSPSPDQSRNSSPVLEASDGKHRTHSTSLKLPIASPLIASVYASPAISSTSESSSLDSSSSSSAFAPTAGSMFQSAFSNLNLRGSNADDGWSTAGVISTDSSDIHPSTSPVPESGSATPSELYDESGDFDAANMLADNDEDELHDDEDDEESQADSRHAGSDDGEDDAPVFYGSSDAPGFTAFQSMMQRKQQGQDSQQQQQQPSNEKKSPWHRPSQHSQPATPTSSSTKARTSSRSYDNSATTLKAGKPPLHAASVAPAPSHKSWSSLLKPTISTTTSQASHHHSTETTSTETTPDSGDHDDDEADTIHSQSAPQQASQPHRPVCVFFLQNACRYGNHCVNRHEFPDNQCTQCGVLLEGDQHAQQRHYDMCSEAAYVAWERSMSWPVECGICYQPTLQINRRFGLLSHCEHAFCLSCIREYRGSLENEPLDESSDRACPICSQVSHFVVPCDRLVVDPARKRLIIDDYKQRLSTIPCKHYVNGNCSFSTSCFYRHDPRDKRELPTQRHHNVYRRTDASSSHDHAYSAVKRRGNKDGVWAVSRSMQLSDFLVNQLSSKAPANGTASVSHQQQRDAG